MDGDIVEGTTCFSEHEKRCISCTKNNCKFWIKSKKHKNIWLKKNNLTERDVEKLALKDIKRGNILDR